MNDPFSKRQKAQSENVSAQTGTPLWLRGGQGVASPSAHTAPSPLDSHSHLASKLWKVGAMRCDICCDVYSPTNEAAALRCGHVFHSVAPIWMTGEADGKAVQWAQACIDNWFMEFPTMMKSCPSCRRPTDGFRDKISRLFLPYENLAAAFASPAPDSPRHVPRTTRAKPTAAVAQPCQLANWRRIDDCRRGSWRRRWSGWSGSWPPPGPSFAGPRRARRGPSTPSGDSTRVGQLLTERRVWERRVDWAELETATGAAARMEAELRVHKAGRALLAAPGSAEAAAELLAGFPEREDLVKLLLLQQKEVSPSRCPLMPHMTRRPLSAGQEQGGKRGEPKGHPLYQPSPAGNKEGQGRQPTALPCPAEFDLPYIVRHFRGQPQVYA